AIRFEDTLVNEYGSSPDELAVAGISQMVDRIKTAIDARVDRSLALIFRCDSRPKESLPQVQERLKAYAEAGADAVGVQLSDIADFRQVGATAPAPLVSLWPKTEMTAFEFFQLGFKIALTPSSIPMAALSAAKEMLRELKEKGTDRDYFSRQKEVVTTEKWY